MKNNFLLFTLIPIFTSSIIQSMDGVTVASTESLLTLAPSKSPNLLFLETTLEKINAKKDINPEKYFADKQKIANTLYSITILRECLFTIKRNYDMCKATEWSAFYDNKYIHGSIVSECSADRCPIPKIKTNLGFLTDHTAYYGDKEYLLVLTTPAERAFYSKASKLSQTKNNPALIFFLQSQLNSTNNDVKIVANSCMYDKCGKALLMETGLNMCRFNYFFNSSPVQNYFSPLGLKTLFTKESIACPLAMSAFNTARKAAPYIAKKIQPLCESSMWDELIQEDLAFNQCYNKIIEDLQSELYRYSRKNYNRLITQYLSIAPELASVFFNFGLKGDLPGVTREKPVQLYIAPKQNRPQQSGKKKRSRAKTQKNKQIQATTTSSAIKESSTANEPTTTVETQTAVAPESSALNHHEQDNSQDNLQTIDILYDNRVIEQNANKNDRCHGFTLMAIPYIIKNGVHSEWTNTRTGHKDDLTILYGEIEYEHNSMTLTELVEFQVCKGADNAIYHIGMRKNNSQNTYESSYNIEFPPLGACVIKHNKSLNDDYGSKLLSETDYMIQLWDGGLKATITLYK